MVYTPFGVDKEMPVCSSNIFNQYLSKYETQKPNTLYYLTTLTALRKAQVCLRNTPDALRKAQVCLRNTLDALRKAQVCLRNTLDALRKAQVCLRNALY